MASIVDLWRINCHNTFKVCFINFASKTAWYQIHKTSVYWLLFWLHTRFSFHGLFGNLGNIHIDVNEIRRPPWEKPFRNWLCCIRSVAQQLDYSTLSQDLAIFKNILHMDIEKCVDLLYDEYRRLGRWLMRAFMSLMRFWWLDASVLSGLLFPKYTQEIVSPAIFETCSGYLTILYAPHFLRIGFGWNSQRACIEAIRFF